MPRNFTQAKVYRIVADDCNDCYIGSTTKPLSIRFSEHKSHHKRYLEGNGNDCASFGLLARPGARIELVDCFVCSDAPEMHAIEQNHINTLTQEGNLNTINIRRANVETYEGYFEAWRNQPVVCECGATVKRGTLYTHVKSKKHKERFNRIIDNIFA